MFETLLGHDLLKAYLFHATAAGTLPQTLLFIGPEGVGKRQFALALSAHLLKTSPERIEGGNHPDFHLHGPEGKGGLYAIETLRRLIDREHTAPFEATRKVFVLDAAERMQPASANALLKTLEEPAPDTQFILITSSPQEILPTILSRCIPLTFHPLPDEAVAALLRKKGFSQEWAKLAQGSCQRAIELATNPQLGEQKQLLFSFLRGPKNYLDVAQKVGQIEALVGEQEDPLLAAQAVEHLFALVLMWHRDQQVRKLGQEKALFFPEEPMVAHSLPPLEVTQKKVAQALLGYQRNLKLSACLELLA